MASLHGEMFPQDRWTFTVSRAAAGLTLDLTASDGTSGFLTLHRISADVAQELGQLLLEGAETLQQRATLWAPAKGGESPS